MILKNGHVFIDGKFVNTDIKTENGKIIAFGNFDGGDMIDCTDKYVLPGLVDIHTHGCAGFDFSTASPDEIRIMRKYYIKNGITTVLATTVSMSEGDIRKAVENIKASSDDMEDGADIAGINLEGPYLSPKKAGAHDKDLLKEPDIDFIESLGDFVKIVNVAPEYENAIDFIKKFQGKVSIAHTDCGYETAMNAVNAGADHITHIFNAMNGLHHREPGVIGAFFDSDATAEIICDGIHILPPILRMMFSSESDRLAIISDSMSATGLSDGEYKLGGLDVFVKNSVATLADGTLAGSAMNLYGMMKNLISIGVEPEKAIKSATAIPADSVSIDAVGHIKEGYHANMVITNKNFLIHKVIFKGKTV